MNPEIEKIVRTMGPEELALFLAIGGEVPLRTPNVFAAKALIDSLQAEEGSAGRPASEGIDKLGRRRKVG